jgi:hypothetical protein
LWRSNRECRYGNRATGIGCCDCVSAGRLSGKLKSVTDRTIRGRRYVGLLDPTIAAVVVDPDVYGLTGEPVLPGDVDARARRIFGLGGRD